ncbi:MAG TPA: hypothetical protein VGN15_14460 [Ktedonobacteraceae bacterium]|nr:hypothetical protein [Ktedonobacteraceae bacterium]
MSLIDQPELQLLILTQIGWELESELRYQNTWTRNRLKSFAPVSGNTALVGDIDMRDVKNAAISIKDMVAQIKKATDAAQAAFVPEAKNAIVNAGKLVSAAGDLKEANKLMEDALGDTGSNFPSQQESESSSKEHADLNGVTLNKG